MTRRRQPVRSRPLKLHPRRVGNKCAAYHVPKVKWRSKIDAQMAMANANNKQGSKTGRTADSKKEVRVYRCPHCSFWHTTSSPLRESSHD